VKSVGVFCLRQGPTRSCNPVDCADPAALEAAPPEGRGVASCVRFACRNLNSKLRVGAASTLRRGALIFSAARSAQSRGRPILFVLLLCLLACFGQGQTIVVGSKRFTESCVLGEIAKKVLTDAGFKVELRQGIGATGIVWTALKDGSISVYPEYTGTISEEILKQPGLDRAAIEKELAKVGIGMSPDLGFNDAYGLAMRRETASKLGITKISDLKAHPDLTAGITPEFLKRKDGWGPLTSKYGIKLKDVRSIDHSLGYAALYAGQVDVKDCYTTDAEIKKYDLVVLQDDLHFLPLYRAVFLYRLDMPAGAIKAIDSLSGKIDESHMIAMNAVGGKDGEYGKAASLFFAAQNGGKATTIVEESLVAQTVRLTKQHLELVGISLLLAILVGIPLGIVASKPGFVGASVLGTAGVIQTIPSLALLSLLVPISFFGITERTAIAALFLYSLLPIVRNTAIGISTIPQGLKESAEALGLEPMARLRKVYLPMALPTILAGIKTSAVINVGTATLAALLGGGGLGEPIFEGLSLNDNKLILEGAIPAALLAIIVQLAFDAFDRLVVPRGLRAK
jgi:osmoprotectant transport system permease protein